MIGSGSADTSGGTPGSNVHYCLTCGAYHLNSPGASTNTAAALAGQATGSALAGTAEAPGGDGAAGGDGQGSAGTSSAPGWALARSGHGSGLHGADSNGAQEGTSAATGTTKHAANPGSARKGATTTAAGSSPQAAAIIAKLQSRDAHVRAHEAAHMAAGGALIRGGASYTYEEGPDGREYAIGGEVSIDSSPVPNDPRATIMKMETVRAAALAPSDPSSADLSVAGSAAAIEAQAWAELAQENAQQSGGSGTGTSTQTQATPSTGATGTGPGAGSATQQQTAQSPGAGGTGTSAQKQTTQWPSIIGASTAGPQGGHASAGAYAGTSMSKNAKGSLFNAVA